MMRQSEGELALASSLQEAKKITEEAVLKELGGLPDAEWHCVKLAVTALRKTIAKYETLETRQ